MTAGSVHVSDRSAVEGLARIGRVAGTILCLAGIVVLAVALRSGLYEYFHGGGRALTGSFGGPYADGWPPSHRDRGRWAARPRHDEFGHAGRGARTLSSVPQEGVGRRAGLRRRFTHRRPGDRARLRGCLRSRQARRQRARRLGIDRRRLCRGRGHLLCHLAVPRTEGRRAQLSVALPGIRPGPQAPAGRRKARSVVEMRPAAPPAARTDRTAARSRAGA